MSNPLVKRYAEWRLSSTSQDALMESAVSLGVVAALQIGFTFALLVVMDNDQWNMADYRSYLLNSPTFRSYALQILTELDFNFTQSVGPGDYVDVRAILQHRYGTFDPEKYPYVHSTRDLDTVYSLTRDWFPMSKMGAYINQDYPNDDYAESHFFFGVRAAVATFSYTTAILCSVVVYNLLLLIRCNQDIISTDFWLRHTHVGSVALLMIGYATLILGMAISIPLTLGLIGAMVSSYREKVNFKYLYIASMIPALATLCGIPVLVLLRIAYLSVAKGSPAAVAAESGDSKASETEMVASHNKQQAHPH